MKITAGKYRGRKVIAPDEKIVRPTLSQVRESIFNTLFSMTDFEGKSFLDMFAGSGIMGLEALSRGFDEAFEMEKNISVVKIIKSNYSSLGIKTNLIVGDSLKKISKLNKSFDVIFIDPPYFSGIYENSLNEITQNNVLNKDAIVILEHVTDVNWSDLGFELIKQKKYSNKFVTFLKKSV